MLPFYHPTTVLVADDEPVFLQSFAYSYGDKFLCRLERSPEAALEALANSHRTWQHRHVLQQSLIEKVDGSVAQGDCVVQLKTSLVSDLLQDPARFATISVLVVDYVMPSMSGIDLCRQIKDLPIKKILLTGRAGDQTAVSAFNEGLIDHFLVKHDAEIGQKLPALVRRMQNAFFESAARPLNVLKDFRSRSFMAHPSIVEHITAILEQHRASEYYVSLDPAGVVFADNTGRIRFIAVADQDELQAQREIAEAAHAPAALVSALHEKGALAIFPTDTGRYDRSLVDRWLAYVKPGHAIETAAGTWWSRVVESTDSALIIPRSTTSLARYKASIDNSAS